MSRTMNRRRMRRKLDQIIGAASQYPPAPVTPVGPVQSPVLTYGPPQSPVLTYGPPQSPVLEYGPPQVSAPATVPQKTAATLAPTAREKMYSLGPDDRKKAADAMLTYVLCATAGGILFGAGGAALWKSHRVLGFMAGSFLVGAPVGAAVGMAVAARQVVK